MTLSSKYKEQVETLLEILPLISSNKNFAIKGGTAINLFLLNLPRLSVDIDLCYVPLSARDQALQEISSFIKELSRRANAIGFKTREKTTLEGYESTLYVRSRKNAEVKVEINLVVRGAVNKPVVKSLVPLAVSMFERNAEILCLDINDLFGGKLCAALDRQHPRDFFDLHMFLNNFSYTRELHQTFIVYLLSSKRPISELIQPNRLNIKAAYEKQFKGMTSLDISCEQLEKTREDIFALTQTFFNDQEKEFLFSFKRGEPQWELFPLMNIKDFPSVKWKLHNILSMSPKKRLESLQKLEKKLRI